MSDFVSLLERLSRLTTTPLLIGLLVTVSGMLLIRNWRLSLPLMIAQYVVVGILMARSVQPGLALIKLASGVLVCLALSVAAQRADDQRSKRGESVASDRIAGVSWRQIPARLLVRAAALGLMLTVAFGAAQRLNIPGVPRELLFSATILAACAMLLIATSPEALNAGLGVLMLISAVELGYTPLESSASVSVILGMMTLMVGMTIAYLTLADSAPDDAPVAIQS